MNTTEESEPVIGRILFADDDEQFRFALGKRLLKAGFAVDFASSAAEAVEKLKHTPHDVLLSDIHMPGNAGLELIESIPAIREGLPIILLTGNPTVETAMKSVTLRVTAYLTKPPNFEELCALLRSAIADGKDLRVLKDTRLRLQNWDHGIQHIQKLVAQVPGTGRQAAMQSYLRLSLRNLIVGLVELEYLLVHEGARLGTDQALQNQDLLNAVHKTIRTLEKTRDHFKSKELGELRKELEQLVSGPSGTP